MLGNASPAAADTQNCWLPALELYSLYSRGYTGHYMVGIIIGAIKGDIWS